MGGPERARGEFDGWNLSSGRFTCLRKPCRTVFTATRGQTPHGWTAVAVFSSNSVDHDGRFFMPGSSKSSMKTGPSSGALIFAS
jgi:hypothetical protein